MKERFVAAGVPTAAWQLFTPFSGGVGRASS